MRIALFSDIHGNITGLKAVLSSIDNLGGADILFAAGDSIGGGPGTEDLLDILTRHNVRMVRGNSEEAALNLDASIQYIPEKFHNYVSATVDWLHENISQPYWKLLESLPLFEEVEFDSNSKLIVCHATPNSPWDSVCAAHAPKKDYERINAEVIAYGHYHEHHVLWLDTRLLVNVASVGMRKDGMSSFTLLEHLDDRWIVQQYSVPYDVREERRLKRQRKVP